MAVVKANLYKQQIDPSFRSLLWNGRNELSKVEGLELTNSHSAVSRGLHKIDLAVKSSHFTFSPLKTGAQAAARAELLKLNIDSMKNPFDTHLNGVLDFLVYGWAVFERVFKKKDGVSLLENLAFIRHKDVTSMENVEGGVALETSDKKGNQIKLPPQKVLHYAYRGKGDDPFGHPLIAELQNIVFAQATAAGLNLEGLKKYMAATPIYQMGPKTTSLPGGKEKAADVAKNIAVGIESHAVLPDGDTLTFMGGQGSVINAVDILEWYNKQISLSLHNLLEVVANNKTGSRALGDTAEGSFWTVIKSILKEITSTFNRQILPQIYALNRWGAVDIEMVATPDTPIDVKSISESAKSGLITWDTETENALRRKYGLPLLAPGTQRSQELSEAEHRCTCGGKDTKAHILEDTLSASKRLYAMQAEKTIDVEKITKSLDGFSAKLIKLILPIRSKTITWIINKILQNVDRDDLENDRYNKAFLKELIGGYRSSFDYGVSGVEKEVKKNISGVNRSTESKYREYASDRIKGVFNFLVSELYNSSIIYDQTPGDQDLSKEAFLISAAGNISGRSWEKLAHGAVNKGFGAGRLAAYAVLPRDDNYVHVYSSVLDRNTCDICGPLDGTIIDPISPQLTAPNPNCLGREDCRCVIVRVLKEEA